MKDVVVSHVLDYHLVGTNFIPMTCSDLVDEDPVIVKEFPLTRSVSNFKVMSQASGESPSCGFHHLKIVWDHEVDGYVHQR